MQSRLLRIISAITRVKWRRDGMETKDEADGKRGLQFSAVDE